MASKKPRLSIVLFLAFLITSIIPVLVVGFWVVDYARDSEYSAVKEKHLLVARNLTLALSRYAKDIESTLQLISSIPVQNLTIHHKNLLSSEDIISYRVFNEQGIEQFAMSTLSEKTTKNLTFAQESLIKQSSYKNSYQFLSVEKNSDEKPIILIVGTIEGTNDYFVAELITDYFVHLQSQIKFGVLGHAAIVDQDGKVLAHPKQEWVDSHKNISKVSAVQRMKNGETGVEQFYSPAKLADMIAGFSVVKQTGWGVMVPQPVEELDDKIALVKRATIVVTLIGIILAMLLSWKLANILAKPTRNLASLSRQLVLSEGNKPIPTAKTVTAYTQEQTDLNAAFNYMVESLSSKNTQLLFSSQHDPLTNLANRNLLREVLSKKIFTKEPFIFVLLDLNEFKIINDHWSHAHGDEVLIQVSQRLINVVGDNGLVTRIGGDEFAIVLYQAMNQSDAEAMTKRLQQRIRETYDVLNDRLTIDSKIGLSRYPQDATQISDLMQCADLAMYVAKQDMKPSFKWFEQSMKNDLDDRIELTQELLDAIENNQFIVHYQPKVDSNSYEIHGFEALVRWNHPTKGVIYPDNFISLAEQNGNIIALGRLIIELVCKDIQQFRKNHPAVQIAINLSVKQFEDNQLSSHIIETLNRYDIQIDNIEFEITESCLIEHSANVSKNLAKLREYGFKLSVDDFGTGHSSLARIKDMDVQKIKIDKAFVDHIEDDEKALGLLTGMVKIAQTLNLDVIIEGVETLKQLNIVSKIQNTDIQGFIFSKAVDSKEVELLMKNKILNPQN